VSRMRCSTAPATNYPLALNLVSVVVHR